MRLRSHGRFPTEMSLPRSRIILPPKFMNSFAGRPGSSLWVKSESRFFANPLAADSRRHDGICLRPPCNRLSNLRNATLMAVQMRGGETWHNGDLTLLLLPNCNLNSTDPTWSNTLRQVSFRPIWIEHSIATSRHSEAMDLKSSVMIGSFKRCFEEA